MTIALPRPNCPPWLPGYLAPFWTIIASSPIGYRLAHGVFWSFSGTVVARALGLIASIIVARLLGRGAYGELGIIQSTVGMFGLFAGFGMGITATKFVAEYRKTDPEQIGR